MKIAAADVGLPDARGEVVHRGLLLEHHPGHRVGEVVVQIGMHHDMVLDADRLDRVRQRVRRGRDRSGGVLRAERRRQGRDQRPRSRSRIGTCSLSSRIAELASPLTKKNASRSPARSEAADCSRGSARRGDLGGRSQARRGEHALRSHPGARTRAPRPTRRPRRSGTTRTGESAQDHQVHEAVVGPRQRGDVARVSSNEPVPRTASRRRRRARSRCPRRGQPPGAG